ncbi:hypothetical protein PF005_g21177 [Phytophthora fragariae]|uniref:Uncharacterized protein n=1 Tax=Phytophthora fragariae TaxID=53985 RepID=A0A6A3E547_9STRA|nr:hypothetical protein PF009_g24830 [Phytophthora fragariae]KAE9066041.1 hypothetical protein PF007_g28629 [Phytophthora fragariae]KAE9068515.1 hypothetical protein PF006_g29774 [Phytophthora fragariae]KAE9084689.1 hypothetical protein PF010_g20734 [Phytophthora fragariae]KAE9170719.1 hypothetical protein PF004_g27787 [Phytophthora fragariae]
MRSASACMVGSWSAAGVEAAAAPELGSASTMARSSSAAGVFCGRERTGHPKQKCNRIVEKSYQRPGSNRRPSACKADVITTTLR